MNEAWTCLLRVVESELGPLPAPDAGLAPRVGALLSLRRLRSGQILFGVGQQPAAFYAVLQGELACRLRGAEGQQSLLELATPPRLFGLAAFVSATPSPYEAAAIRASRVLVIGRAAYAELMDGWPGFARALLAHFAQRFSGNLRQLEAARHLSAEQRLQLALEQLRQQRGQASGRGWSLRLSQAELAELAGVSRQTANAWLRAQPGLRLGYRCIEGAQ